MKTIPCIAGRKLHFWSNGSCDFCGKLKREHDEEARTNRNARVRTRYHALYNSERGGLITKP